MNLTTIAAQQRGSNGQHSLKSAAKRLSRRQRRYQGKSFAAILMEEYVNRDIPTFTDHTSDYFDEVVTFEDYFGEHFDYFGIVTDFDGDCVGRYFEGRGYVDLDLCNDRDPLDFITDGMAALEPATAFAAHCDARDLGWNDDRRRHNPALIEKSINAYLRAAA